MLIEYNTAINIWIEYNTVMTSTLETQTRFILLVQRFWPFSRQQKRHFCNFNKVLTDKLNPWTRPINDLSLIILFYKRNMVISLNWMYSFFRVSYLFLCFFWQPDWFEKFNKMVLTESLPENAETKESV